MLKFGKNDESPTYIELFVEAKFGDGRKQLQAQQHNISDNNQIVDQPMSSLLQPSGLENRFTILAPRFFLIVDRVPRLDLLEQRQLITLIVGFISVVL